MNLPQVHIAVNVSGLAAAIGSTLGTLAMNAAANPTCVASLAPAKDALAVTAVLGALAAFLPTKKPAPTSVGNTEQIPPPSSGK